MNKERMLMFSVCCLSIALLLSSIIIAKGIERSGDYISSGIFGASNNISQSINNAASYNNVNTMVNMDIDMAAAYLGVEKSDVVKMINTEGLGFPYVKVSSKYIINKNALDQWLETARVELE